MQGGIPWEWFDGGLMQGGRATCYHSKMFHGGVLNHPTYDQELYALVQVVKKWKHYLMGKETIIHTNHQLIRGILGSKMGLLRKIIK